MTERRPAEAFPAGEYLKDALDDRGWTQNEFAAMIGVSPAVINQIISGKRSITPETAQGIGAALDTSAMYWMNLDAYYRLWRAGPASERIGKEAELRKRFAVREIQKRRWIPNTEDPDVLKTHLLAFSELPDIKALPRLKLAAKRSNYETELTPAQEAWFWRVRQLAQATPPTSEYKENAFRRCLDDMRVLMSEADEIRHIPKMLSSCGVRFVIVEPLPASKIDGVCFWLDAKSPVIGLSLRYDRIDNFWFVLRHECEHVLRKDGSGDALVDVELTPSGAAPEGEDSDPAEKAANEAAAEYCVAQEALENWIGRVAPLYSEERVLSLAASLGVHPGLVVGQLQRRLEKWDWLRKHLIKVRQFIAPAAITDGYGQDPVTT